MGVFREADEDEVLWALVQACAEQDTDELNETLAVERSIALLRERHLGVDAEKLRAQLGASG